MAISFSSPDGEKDKVKTFKRTKSDPIPIPSPARGGPRLHTGLAKGCTPTTLDGAGSSSTPPPEGQRARPRGSQEVDLDTEEEGRVALQAWESVEEDQDDDDDDDGLSDELLDAGGPAGGLADQLDKERLVYYH